MTFLASWSASQSLEIHTATDSGHKFVHKSTVPHELSSLSSCGVVVDQGTDCFLGNVYDTVVQVSHAKQNPFLCHTCCGPVSVVWELVMCSGLSTSSPGFSNTIVSSTKSLQTSFMWDGSSTISEDSHGHPMSDARCYLNLSGRQFVLAELRLLRSVEQSLTTFLCWVFFLSQLFASCWVLWTRTRVLRCLLCPSRAPMTVHDRCCFSGLLLCHQVSCPSLQLLVVDLLYFVVVSYVPCAFSFHHRLFTVVLAENL